MKAIDFINVYAPFEFTQNMQVQCVVLAYENVCVALTYMDMGVLSFPFTVLSFSLSPFHFYFAIMGIYIALGLHEPLYIENFWCSRLQTIIITELENKSLKCDAIGDFSRHRTGKGA